MHFHRYGQGPDAHPPRQLPGDDQGFVNRTDELQQLNAVLPSDGDAPLVVSVYVIAGTAGVGKTSLALRWAHKVRDRFPHGQLYVNLRGYDPREPVTAQSALQGFLTALGVPPRAIPQNIEEAAALYRSRLADRRVLVVLDNAATTRQVRPLLPGSTGSLALVTSRSRLSGLAIRDGARRLTLGTLPERDAVELIRVVTAGYRPGEDTDKLFELAQLCARLPLALRIAAERAATRPYVGLDDLIADLRDESALWTTLSTDDDDDADSVRTVFAWSYRALSASAARVFRLLGIHPGPEIGIHAAAALTGLAVRMARQSLDSLVGGHLVEQSGPDRYEFHDLLRAYANDEALRQETVAERERALRRVLDWYLHTLDAAHGWIEPEEDRLPLDPPTDGIAPITFTDRDQAVDWVEREHVNLLAAVRAARAEGLDRHVWRMSALLYYAMAPSAPLGDRLAMTREGLDAVRRLGDRAGEASMLERLGMARNQMHQLAEARECHERALAIRRELGDRDGEAQSLNVLGLVHFRGRELALAERYFTRARTAFAELRQRHWEIICLTNLSATRYEGGRLDEALEDVDQALAAHRQRGSRAGMGEALRLLSLIRLEQGDLAGAKRAATESVSIALELREPVMEAFWLLSLGNAQRALGDHGEALASFQRSALLHRRLGDRSREALAWSGAGETYRAMNRPSEAADFHRRAAAVHRETREHWHEASALLALADALAETDPDEARHHRARARELVGGYDDPRASALRAALDR
ncbi:tetratricopeptide repeat protein [Streptomyces sp. PT12]|uniref:ATP-binding protein n=1 Tax=Streptomyces sp. PT12 TaxID=1510197 RepID=UPI000DE2AAFB|nr:tetratricopeptide repeat protein [Streptomyces sp. PT12]RBM20202.1 hypothetical protein DEH69_08665 [Streptomyces sp. PT12]